jgi:hypothetical protein
VDDLDGMLLAVFDQNIALEDAIGPTPLTMNPVTRR